MDLKKTSEAGSEPPAASTSGVSRRKLIRDAATAGLAIAFGGQALAGSGFASTLFGRQGGGAATDATITITDERVGRLPQRFIGLSYEKAMLSTPLFRGDNEALIRLFRMIGPGQLRIGGNTVDWTTWNAKGAGTTKGETAPSDIRALADFIKATGWTVLYGLNLAASTPAAAADEAAQAVRLLGHSLEGIEIGNECDLYRKHYFDPWTLDDFITRWESFRHAILQTSPHVRITGPASASHIEQWTIPFGKRVGRSEIDLLTQHYYRGNGKSPTSTFAKLVSADPALRAQLKELKAAARSIGIPYRMAETNSFYNGGRGGVSDSCASALWVIDHCLTIAHSGADGLNLHGGGGGPGYTPIANSPQGEVTEARPEFYGLLAVHSLGQGDLLKTTGGDDLLTAYAVRSHDRLRTVVVNKHNAPRAVGLETAGGKGLRFNSSLLTCPSLEATSGETYDGQTVGADGKLMGSAAASQLAASQLTASQLAAASPKSVVLVPAFSAIVLSETS